MNRVESLEGFERTIINRLKEKPCVGNDDTGGGKAGAKQGLFGLCSRWCKWAE